MNIPADFKSKLDSVTNKRVRFLIDTILEKGFCSTEDLKTVYEHAPRAARDARELGIPLETFYMKDSSGKRIGAYRLGDWEEAKKENQLAKSGGRTQLTTKLKKALIDRYGAYCHLYNEEYPERLLQPDHRIPYEIAGDPPDMQNTDYFMLLCPSANRDKSWTCEHCINWTRKSISMCKKCYYAYPENYNHVAGNVEARIQLVFKNAEFPLYEALSEFAKENNQTIQEYIKMVLDRVHRD